MEPRIQEPNTRKTFLFGDGTFQRIEFLIVELSTPNNIFQQYKVDVVQAKHVPWLIGLDTLDKYPVAPANFHNLAGRESEKWTMNII